MSCQSASPKNSKDQSGFDRARSIMWCYDARARVHERLVETSFLFDEKVAAVHVENTSRTDRVFITAFDHAGQMIGGDTLYVDDSGQRLDITPEFDHDFNRLKVPLGSELAEAIAHENGWIIDMEALRQHDPDADRRATQRAVLLAHLGDLLASGDAHLLLNRTSTPEGPEKSE